MTPRRSPRKASARGAALLEAMIALTVLLIGLVGMARLQIYGMGATQGARAQTIATQLATELGTALSFLPTGDPRLIGAPGVTSSTPPAIFGQLLPLGVPTTGVYTWNDGAPIPGARLDATLEPDPEQPARPVFQRRWTVWDAGVTATGTAAKVIAVSVIWRERTIAKPKEVVVYASSEVRGAFMRSVSGLR